MDVMSTPILKCGHQIQIQCKFFFVCVLAKFAFIFSL